MVEDRSATTLIPIIKNWILPGTTIFSDCWRSYSSLQNEGYIHATVNQGIQFVSESGTHTNNADSCWCAVKKSLSRYSTRKELYNSYFAKYCIQCTCINTCEDKFFLPCSNLFVLTTSRSLVMWE